MSGLNSAWNVWSRDWVGKITDFGLKQGKDHLRSGSHTRFFWEYPPGVSEPYMLESKATHLIFHFTSVSKCLFLTIPGFDL